MGEQRVRVGFGGGAWASLGYTLLGTVLAICVIPAAWGAVAIAAWWCDSLRFSDGTRAVFEGRAGRVWPLFAVLVFLALLPSLATAGLPHGHRASAVQLLLALVLIPFDAAVKLPLYRWFFENIRLSSGGTPRFHGRYAPYLGWVLLMTVSFVTVIGWAWVATAMARWFCRNIEGDGYGVAFVGTGWGLLWRSVVWLVCFVLVLPIPWVLRSMYRWWTNHIEIIRHTTVAPPSFPA